MQAAERAVTEFRREIAATASDGIDLLSVERRAQELTNAVGRVLMRDARWRERTRACRRSRWTAKTGATVASRPVRTRRCSETSSSRAIYQRSGRGACRGAARTSARHRRGRIHAAGRTDPDQGRGLDARGGGREFPAGGRGREGQQVDAASHPACHRESLRVSPRRHRESPARSRSDPRERRDDPDRPRRRDRSAGRRS